MSTAPVDLLRELRTLFNDRHERMVRAQAPRKAHKAKEWRDRIDATLRDWA